MNVPQSYREASALGASPVELVVRLYEKLIEDLRQVQRAIENNDVGLRSNRIKHAILIVGHLQSSLDFEKGGKVARDLEKLYNNLRNRLLSLQFQPTGSGTALLLTDLMALREAWVEVDRAERPSATSTGMPASGPAGDRATMHWNG